jgi:hypothetical protein
MSDINNLDAPIWGAAAIALAAGLIRPDGSPDEDAFYYKAARGYLAVEKRGRVYVTTRRKILEGLLNDPDAAA